MALNTKQQRFCDEYLIDLNATQAAIRAGYSKKTAYSQGQRLLKHVEISAYISVRMAEKSKELIADQDEVLKYLTSVMRGEEKEECLKMDGNGYQRIEVIDVSAKDRLKAAELLGKRYSLFKDNVDVNGAIPVVIGGDDGLED